LSSNKANAKAGRAAWVFVVLLLFSLTAGAAAAEPALIVGTKESPPFAMKDEDGEWHGVSIDLWRSIAEALGIDYELREYELAELVQGLASGEVDVGAAALTVTAERETAFDFSHPFYTSGLGIATSAEPAGIYTILLGLVSIGFLRAVAALALVLFLVGAAVWWFERRRNADQFGGGVAQGLGSGFWWSAVTMTTVGYGDKAPVTPGGRLVALLWMFASIVLISGFTGAIASSLTVGRLSGKVQGPQDLPGVRVVTLSDSTSEAYLRAEHIRYRAQQNSVAALEAVASGEADAMVYDAPLLQYLVSQQFGDQLQVLPNTFQRQDYAIALAPGSELRERINRVLVQRIQSPQWKDTLYRYLGQP
jgi:ABC-type amino acid transport substrate-binding protein